MITSTTSTTILLSRNGNTTSLREISHGCRRKGYPLISAVADMWVSNTHKVESNTSDTYTYQTFNLTDPDEFANFKDNGAYTNAGIKIIMAAAVQAAQLLNVTPSSAWVDVGDNIDIPVDPESGIILEYTGFNGSTPVKQGITLP
jgi:trehalose/maltose hydrolase-like predicted phosphorylase